MVPELNNVVGASSAAALPANVMPNTTANNIFLIILFSFNFIW
jgi:hypothetical protein